MKPMVTVLHIDDDPDIRLLARELAADAGRLPGNEIEIRWLESGSLAEAVTEFASVRPDVILLDNRLSGPGGIELLPSIFRIWQCPVWILTGLSRAVVYEHFRERGAAGVISKDDLLQSAEQLQTFLAAQSGAQRGANNRRPQGPTAG
jgi:CheY-like chemotaxis protein